MVSFTVVRGKNPIKSNFNKAKIEHLSRERRRTCSKPSLLKRRTCVIDISVTMIDKPFSNSWIDSNPMDKTQNTSWSKTTPITVLDTSLDNYPRRMIPLRLVLHSCLRKNYRELCRKYSSSSIRSTANDTEDLGWILNLVSDGKLTPSQSEAIIRRQFESSKPDAVLSPNELLKSFADIDHTRSSRTGFPEAVFGAGKTPDQIAMILDDMARHFNEKASQKNSAIENCERAILATRYVIFGSSLSLLNVLGE